MSQQWAKKDAKSRATKARRQNRGQNKDSKHCSNAVPKSVPLPAAAAENLAYNSPLSFSSLAYLQREARAQYGIGGSSLATRGADEARGELQSEWGLMAEETFEILGRRLSCGGCGLRFKDIVEWERVREVGDDNIGTGVTEVESELEILREEMEETPVEKVDAEMVEMWKRKFQGIEACWMKLGCADCKAEDEVRYEWLGALGLGELEEEGAGVGSSESGKRKLEVASASASALRGQGQEGGIGRKRVNPGEEVRRRRQDGKLESGVEGNGEEDIWAELMEARLVEKFAKDVDFEDIVGI